MILSSVIIILREVLEAALLLSLLLALGNRQQLPKYWLAVGFAGGLVGAMLFANFVGPLSDLFDGTGQELLDAFLHVLITLTLLGIVLIWRAKTHPLTLAWLSGLAVMAAVIREGSEIWIYYYGYMFDSKIFVNTLLGGAIGLGIGSSVGALLYYILVLLPAPVFRWSTVVLLALVAAGMTSQAMNSLTQADYIEASKMVWNSSTLIDENSISGQLLYALIGYEATPSIYQVVSYLAVLACFLLAGWWYKGYYRAIR